MSAIVEKQALENEKVPLVLLFCYGPDNKAALQPTKNIYINTNVPDMFQFEGNKVCSRLDCRKHYEKDFDRVYITYSHENGLHIRALKSFETRQELFVPERYIICVGVDYESEQPE